MRRILSLILLFVSVAASAGSTRTLFDFDWRFTRQDVPSAVAPDFDDSSWEAVNLPHDWDIYCAPTAGAPTLGGGGYYPAGIGWYRKSFARPEGESVRLHFEGVYQKATVYVNGKVAGTHAYGYTPFTLDITSLLKDGLNTVSVKVDNSLQPNCRWYSGSGIYRHVWMETSDKLHIAQDGVFITTPSVTSESASVRAEVGVVNESERTRTVSVSALGDSKDITLAPGETGAVVLESKVAAPHLWSPEDPHRYTAEVAVSEGGKRIDYTSVKYGIRTFSYSADSGFTLNGKSFLISGTCVHHDDGALGAAAFDRAEIRKVQQMKEAGFNLIRTSHNPTTTAFLNACDSLGMLVIGEIFDGWRTMKTDYDYSTLLDSCYREDISAMVMRDRNHPSIICWSIGNEIIERKDIRVIQTAKDFKRVILSCDTTRPVTEALCSWDADWEIYDPHADVLDIVGYNYMIHKHAGDHLRDPERIIWQTESYPRDAFSNWALTNDYPYIIGDIVWTGLDYLGEASIGRWYYRGDNPGEHYQGDKFPWHGAYCGDVDITGWRKPISHYREMLWNRETAPEIYLAVKEPDGYNGKVVLTSWSVWPTWESWNWNGHEGKEIEAEIYTTAPAVNLYLNGKLVATRNVDRSTEFKATVKLPYQPGVLKAVALDGNGKETGAVSELKTAGNPNKLRLTTDRKTISADGQDLSYIIVEVLDKNGNIVPDAQIPLDVKVKGAGSLAAAVNADMTDCEPYTTSHVTTWHGRAMIVARSGRAAGKLTVETMSSLRNAKISVEVR